MRIILDAPADRLALMMAVITIGLLVGAIRVIWRENTSLRSELNTLHALHQEITRRLIEATGRRDDR